MISALRLRLPQIVGEEQDWIRDDGRAFGFDSSAYSQFTVAIDPANDGVRLTRRSDTIIGNQRADVLVDGVKVATWPGLRATSGPAYGHESVELPASATAGKSRITIRNAFVSSDFDVNEFTYWVDSKVGGAYERTDVMDIGQLHLDDERAHDYVIDKQTWQGIANNPRPQTEEERAQAAARVAPSDARLRDVRVRIAFDGERDNRGVRLRRRSDQEASYQAAQVLVDGRDAGTWRQPLGNRFKRWLEDDFELPAALTANRSELRIELRPLAGAPAWQAARYEALARVKPFTDRDAPEQVAGLEASGAEDNAIDMRWRGAGDDLGVAGYEVYGSRRPGVAAGPATLLGTVRSEGFRHSGVGLGETWHYRVRALDAAGNAGPLSGEASATSGDTLRVEAESLLPAAAGTTPATRQASCCGATWSGGAQVWLQADGAGDSFSLDLDVPQDGGYDLSTLVTRAADYGIHTLAVDGEVVGQPFDAYGAGLEAGVRSDYGALELAAGTHRLTWTVTGKDPAARGFLAGIDTIVLTLNKEP
jgi:hypothetical protein